MIWRENSKCFSGQFCKKWLWTLGFCFVLWLFFFFKLSCQAISSWAVLWKSCLISVENIICLPLPGNVFINNRSVEIVLYTPSELRGKSPKANISLCLKGFLFNVIWQNWSMNSFAVGKLNLKHMYLKYLPESREEMRVEINWLNKAFGKFSC